MRVFEIQKIGGLVLLLTAAINIRIRLDDTGLVHLGGADYAVSPGMLICLLLIPLIIFRVIMGRIQYGKYSLWKILALTTLPLCFSLLTAIDSNYTMLEIARQLFFTFMVFVFLDSLKGQNVSWVYQALVMIVVLQAIVIVLHTLNLSEFMLRVGQFSNKEVSRQIGLLGHPNILASVLNLVAPFFLAAAYYTVGRKRNLFIMMFVFASVLIIYSFSRSGILVLICTSGYVLLMARDQHALVKKIFFSVLACAVAVIIVFVFSDELVSRFTQGQDSGIIARIRLNNVALEAFSANPLIGSGGNNFTYFAPYYDNSGITAYWNRPVHNSFLLIASETGLIGLCMFFALIFLVFKGLRSNSMSMEMSIKKVSLGAEGAFLGLLLGGLFTYFIRQDVALPLMALIVAIALKRPSRQYKNY